MQRFYRTASRASVLMAGILALLLVPSVGPNAGLLDNILKDVSIPTSLSEQKPAITTSLNDVVTEVPFLDDFDPQDAAPMTRLPRGPHNGFMLTRRGLFEFKARSYCLHAGTYAPGGGDGYAYAPVKGPRAEIIRKIAQRSVDHMDIPQQEVQSLIWAVLARTKISDMSPEMQSVAARLLTHEEILELNGGALEVVSSAVMDRFLGKVSDALRPIYEAEANLRSAFSRADATYEELERIAVLQGDPSEPGEGSREMPSGRWSYHPDGYFVRYIPHGYPTTDISLYVPEHFAVDRDAKNRITAIVDGCGNRIEVEYDDQSELAVTPGEDGVRACAFKTVRLINYRPVGPEMVQERTYTLENTGWTLVGRPEADTCAADSSGRYANLAERYAASRDRDVQTRELFKNAAALKHMDWEPQPCSADLTDLGHLAAGLYEAFNVSSMDVDDDQAWVPDHVHMAKKAWMYAFAVQAGACEKLASSRNVTVASAALAGLLINASDDPCAGDPSDDTSGAGEYDPTEGAAQPGNTSRQRLLQSAAPADPDAKNPDCGNVADIKKDMEKIRDAFKNNKPLPGEDGFEYAKRIQGMLGYKPGDPSSTAISPMHTTGNCTIQVNEAYYQSQPSIIRSADCAHEKVHQAKCRWAFNNAAGGYISWMSNAQNYRQNELDAYQAGLDALEDWMNQNGCGQ